ncbi:GvpL/GvpF family gas vesicle protein [Streptomyces sp. SID14478]|uniref:GvpL/GvpF family gas vesicle protein n=1 Tax=Streptomyces sp. SID14478 TaxID=2706073 RepID=UPI0013DD0084|nr:GvpL/GvpF family gas vesicle protein [Streptomyces sp. SID14478]NEB77981.1 GvpL/GvpF family gas vesicle protein [Streptomyces sp. SID14478]
MTSGDLCYVYAVCHCLSAPLQAELVGVGDVAPRQLEHHGLVAIVGAVPERDFAEASLRARLEDLDWLTVTARAHERVIAALTTVTDPLPLRLATVFRDESGVRSMLENEEDRLRAGLDRLAGRVEWGVKVYVEEPAAEPAEAATPAASGREYLRRRRAERGAHDATWRRAEVFAQRLHDDLALRAAATRSHPPQNPEIARVGGRNVLNASYLVPRAESEEFVERVGATKEDESGLRVELTGPWAGYSFTDEGGGTP